MRNLLFILIAIVSYSASTAYADGMGYGIHKDASMEVEHEMDMGEASHEMEDEASHDPYEHFNRKIFVFNDTLDRYTLKPLAKGYRFITPDPVERGINNVFANLGEVNTTFNSLLQGKFKNGAYSFVRLLVNSTYGVGGIFDVASRLDVHADKETFAQTLGVWGVPRGPYLVLPFLGSSTPRNAAGILPDIYMYPVTHMSNSSVRDKIYLFDLVRFRANLLESEKLIVGDRYTFIRDYYLNKIEQDTFGIEPMAPEEDDFVE